MNNTKSEMSLRADGISKTYSSESGVIRVLDHISLELSKGDFVTISGPSGCGKSSLVKIIAGIWKPLYGTVHQGKVRSGIYIAPQEPYIFQSSFESLLFLTKTVA